MTTNPDQNQDDWLQEQFDYVLKKATGKTYPGQRQKRVNEAKAAILAEALKVCDEVNTDKPYWGGNSATLSVVAELRQALIARFGGKS